MQILRSRVVLSVLSLMAVSSCPSFGSLMWPQRGHDATPREMALAAKDCTCEVDPVEISSWLAYDLLPTTMGAAKAQAPGTYRGNRSSERSSAVLDRHRPT